MSSRSPKQLPEVNQTEIRQLRAALISRQASAAQAFTIGRA